MSYGDYHLGFQIDTKNIVKDRRTQFTTNKPD